LSFFHLVLMCLAHVSLLSDIMPMFHSVAVCVVLDLINSFYI
jgi:hypothetical protein